MWKFLTGKSGSEAEEKALQEWSMRLSAVAEEVALSEGQKANMKAAIMSRLDDAGEALPGSLHRVAEQVRTVSREEFLGSQRRLLLFRSIAEKIETRARRWLNVSWIFRNFRVGIASALVLMLVVGLFVTAPLELRVTRASKWTFLEDVQGEVYVNRDGRTMAVDKNFALQEGDLIFTRQNSFVAIRFLDDSVTRLGADTSLQITKLYVKPGDAVKTQVGLSLIGGRVWASVYNLVDPQSTFVIETENARADVDSRAVFALQSATDTTTLTVFDNVVDISKKTSRVDNIQPVVAGFTASVSTSPFKVTDSQDGIDVKKNQVQNDQWVTNNLVLDQQHQENLKQENMQFVSSAVVSDQTLGALADFRDGTKALFANAQVEQARQRFLDVHMGFIKAQEYLNLADKGNQYRSQATPLLIQYKTAIREIMAGYPQLVAADAGQAQELLQTMKEEVGLQDKALSLVMPDEKLYDAKEVVMDAESYFAITSADRASYLLERAQNRLWEMQNLIAKNSLKEAQAVFTAYLTGLDDLVKEVENAQVSEIEGSLFQLLDEQIAQFKALSAIESELKQKGDKRFTALVNGVRSDSLKKLLVIVKYYRKNGIPFATVLELKNTSQEFFEDSADKTQMMSDLEKILADYPEYAQYKEQEKISTEAVDTADNVIVDFEASKDLQACTSNCGQQQP